MIQVRLVALGILGALLLLAGVAWLFEEMGPSGRAQRVIRQMNKFSDTMEKIDEKSWSTVNKSELKELAADGQSAFERFLSSHTQTQLKNISEQLRKQLSNAKSRFDKQEQRLKEFEAIRQR